jgi:hypothetical protein
MFTLSPSLVPSNNGWYLENNPITNYQSYVHRDPEISESLIYLSTNYHATQVQLDLARPPTAITGDSKMSKKIFHNASERDRRRKMNDLYSTLRSLLPGADEMVYIIHNYLWISIFWVIFFFFITILMMSYVNRRNLAFRQQFHGW